MPTVPELPTITLFGFYPVPMPPPGGYAALLLDVERNAEEDSAGRRFVCNSDN